MKKNLKFLVAIVGITVATFGSITNAKIAANVTCKSYGTCGTADNGATITGQV